MKKKLLISILLVFLIWISWFGYDLYDFAKGVKEVIPKNIEYFEKNRDIKVFNPDQQIDTINIDDYNIIFFHPNEKEFENLIKEYGEESERLYEVDSDFGFYLNRVYDSISKTNFKIKIVDERIIKYSTKNGIKFLDRLKNNEHPYGIIFNRENCEPKIEFGVMTDVAIFQELIDYNKNCK